MADDIDDLLDECDDLLDNCHSPNKPNQKPSSKSNFSSKNATRKEDKKLKGLAVILRAFQSFPRFSKYFFGRLLLCGMEWHRLNCVFNP